MVSKWRKMALRFLGSKWELRWSIVRVLVELKTFFFWCCCSFVFSLLFLRRCFTSHQLGSRLLFHSPYPRSSDSLSLSKPKHSLPLFLFLVPLSCLRLNSPKNSFPPPSVFFPDFSLLLSFSFRRSFHSLQIFFFCVFVFRILSPLLRNSL